MILNRPKILFRKLLKHTKKEKGQALVEFALVLPILLVVLCGIIDFGWILSCQNELTNAAGETARYAAIYANSSDVHTLAEEFLTAQGITGTPHLDNLTIDDTYATVEVSEVVPYLTGLTGVFTRHNTITLHGKASMPIEPYETEEETDEETDPETEPETTPPPETSGTTPEPSEPETSSPETSEPETSAPETSAPETSSPETSEAPAAGSVHLVNSTSGMTVTMKPQNSWNDGSGTRYQIDFVITNTTSTAWNSDWICSIDMGCAITNPAYWGPNCTVSGNVLTIKPGSWGGNIAANGTYSFSAQITVPNGVTLSEMTIR